MNTSAPPGAPAAPVTAGQGAEEEDAKSPPQYHPATAVKGSLARAVPMLPADPAQAG